MRARRTFERRGMLHGRFEVYGATAGGLGGPSVRAGFTITHVGGQELAATEATPLVLARDGTLGRNFGIALDQAAPGEYQLTVLAEDEANGARAEAQARFVVERDTPPE